MGFNPFRKKSLWDDITNAVGAVADKVIPGNQSSWHDQGQAPAQQHAAPIVEDQPQVNFNQQQQPDALSVITKPAQSSFNAPKDPLTVQPITQTQSITQPTPVAQPTIAQPKPTYNVAAVDQGLNQGKSWEQISKETNTDVNTVKAHSQATRPNYGMKTDNYLTVDFNKKEAAVKNTTSQDIGGIYDKLPGDQQKTYTENLKAMAADGNFAAQNTLKTLEDQGKYKITAGKVLHGIGNFGHDAIFSVKNDAVNSWQGIGDTARGELAREDLSRNTDQVMARTKEYTRLFNNPAWSDAEYAAKWKDPAFVAQAKAFTANKVPEVSQQTQDDLATAQKVDAKKTAFAAGSTALNVGTLGLADLATVPLKQVGKIAVKEIAGQALKSGSWDVLENLAKAGGEQYAQHLATEVAKQGGKTAARQLAEKVGAGALKDGLIGVGFGTVQTGTHNPDATMNDFIKGGAIGGTVGAITGGLIPVAGAGKSKVVNIVNDKLGRAPKQSFWDQIEGAIAPKADALANTEGVGLESNIATTAEETAAANAAPAPVINTAEDAVTQQAAAPVTQKQASTPNTPRADVPTFTGTIDDVTKQKTDELIAKSEATPRPPDTTRVFQHSVGDGSTPWVFDNVDSLASYKNNITHPNDQFVFHDVPNGSLNATANGEHVFTMNEKPSITADAPPAIPSGNNLGLEADAQARFGNRPQTLPADDIVAKYGGDKASVQRNIDRYGEEQTRNMYARKSDALPFNPDTGEGIKNIDAVATAELKKANAGKVRITDSSTAPAQMSPEELASLDASAPNAVPPVNAPTQAETVQAAANIEKDPALLAANEPAPVSAATPDPVVTDPIPPSAAVPDPAAFPEIKVTDSPIGTMAQDFYDSKQGNQAIKYRDLEQLGKNITSELRTNFKAIGSDFNTVAHDVQAAAEHGIPVEGVGLTPEETALWTKAEQEMDYLRRRASLGGREIGQGDLGSSYFPSQRPGEYQDPASLFQGFRDVKPGNEFARKAADEGGIPLAERDYSPEVVGQYVTRYADTKLLNEDRIARAVQKNNPNATEEVVSEATSKIVAIQDKLNSARNKISLGGFGKRVLVSDGAKFDVPAELATVGRDLGRPQVDVIGTPHGLTNGDKINSVMIDNKPLGDALGLNQHRDAASYAGPQVVEAGGDRAKLAESVRQKLARDYNLPADDIQYMVDSVSRIATNVPDEVVTARVTGTYTNAAKQQIMEQLQNVNIKNPALRSAVSDLTTQILREGSVEQNLSSKVIRSALTAQNAVFRKFNVSSAMNELSDLTSFLSVYGKELKAIRPDFSTLKTYGLGEPDAAIEPFLKDLEGGSSFKDVASKINNATNLYHFVETYKAAVVATSARDSYVARGLVGDDLTKAILNDYRNLTLPVDAFTKTFLDNYPLYTQYLTWGARNIQKEGRLATGKIEAGVLNDMTQQQRIARNLYANLPAKTVFWLASNGLKGTAITTAFGLTDFTGLTNQDYSGIAPEDKSAFDRTTQVTNSSTTLSLLNSIYQGYEKEQLKNSDKYKNASYNPYKSNNLTQDIVNTRTPQIIKNVAGPIGSDTNRGAIGLMKDGYSQNKDGRVQYEAPTDPYNIVKAFVFGKGQTDNAREYQGTQNVIQRVQNGDNPIKAVTDMAKEQTGAQDPNYNRPLTQQYSDAYKAKEAGARTALLQGGRQYNDYLDNFKKTDPTDYNAYIASLDGNHVSPEYWKSIGFDAKGGTNMSTFDMIANRKKQAFKDLGTAYEPTYDLSGDQAKSVIQLKSAATGDDLALRGVLNKEGWYKDYTKRVSDYYANNPNGGGSDKNFPETQRVKDWNGLSDKLNSYYYDKTAKDVPEWGKTFPMVYEQKRINDTYGFDSQESKDFFKNNADAYHAQKDGFDAEQLGVINEMRKIEGVPPMGIEAYKQATNVADTSGKAKKGYGGGGSKGSSVDSKGKGSFGSAQSTGLKTISVNAPKVAIKSRAQSKKAIKVTHGGKI